MRLLSVALVLCLALPGIVAAQTPREKKVRDDRKKIEEEGFWIYNDLTKGFAEAKKTGKPMLVVLRCLPCSECVKLDDDVVNQDKRIRPLLAKFVRVRVISTNGLDLSLFQFDFDQSFAACMLNADGTIYGRFGTRSHRTSWADDVSVEGLAKALQGTLDLHEDFKNSAKALAGKKGKSLEFATPEKFPLMEGKYTATLNYQGDVVKSCIHCHQIGDAQRDYYRKKTGTIPETVLYPYPHPKSLGLILDPKERATVSRVVKDSVAEKAGFAKGDVIESLAGQPMLSIADVQWVLHQTSPDGGKVVAKVKRGEKSASVTLNLEKGWRQNDDLSWRSSSWGLRRMSLGGMKLESLSAEARKKADAPSDGMALRVQHVGQYGAHAAAHRAGVRANDILVSFDGKTDFSREQDILVYGVTKKKPGDKVTLELLRGGKKLSLTVPMQE